VRRVRPALPVLLMTGFVDTAVGARAHDAGIAAVLIKPLTGGDLARGIAAAIAAARSESTSPPRGPSHNCD
jgi:AmiR/NasT family two-component response regulator